MTDQDTDIGSYRVKRGTFVYVLFHGLHNSPALWDDPDAFQPQRWGEKGAQYARPSAAAGELGAPMLPESREMPKRFLPFSDGPRSCIAQVVHTPERLPTTGVRCLPQS